MAILKTRNLFHRFVLVVFGALLFVAGHARLAEAQETWLIDLGDSNDFRSTSVGNPDYMGHYWNSVGSEAYWSNLLDTTGNPSSLALEFDYVTGDDSYNGPAGITFNPNDAVFNTNALGYLAVGAAVYDYYVSSGFEIQGLNPSSRYNLTFFGSHAYSTDAATVYTLYTDSTYSNAVTSTSLNVQIPSNSGQWNTNQLAILNNVSPQPNGVMYIGFYGSNGTGIHDGTNLGYLNAMEIQVASTVITSNTVSPSTGATVPWITYEAENMTNTGTVLGPSYAGNDVPSESSGRQCVQLSTNGAFMQFTAQTNANGIVVRYSVPDTTNGVGTNYTLSLYTNGIFAAELPMTSQYSWLYGAYPFTNIPTNGSPRNFFDEVRTNGWTINPGDVIRLQKNASDTASFYDIDLVDLENVPKSISPPGGSVSVKASGAAGDGVTDDTSAIQNCISGNSNVYLPPGNYKVTGLINIPSGRTIQGAGMWYTTLVGDPTLYTNSSRRVTLNGNGSNIHLSDIAITGKLNYRNDNEPNDGIGGSYGTGSTISNMWVEHTKTGAWLINSQGLVVNSCRFRDTIADGCNLVVGMRSCTVTNCTARGTGDDCFPMWPTTYTTQNYFPGFNVITHCTAQVPFLANGGAIYGGVSNTIQDCQFQDIPYGCGILISTTFPVGTNSIKGAVAQRCNLLRCGGYDPGYEWRAALQLCLDTYTNGISGVNLNNLNITDSLSDGLSIIGGTGSLSNAIASYVNIPDYEIGVSGRNALWARSDAVGSMTISNSTIVEYRNDSPNFTFYFVTSNIPVTVQTSPAGLSFTVDGTNYGSAQALNWVYGSNHSIATASPQSGGAGVQYVWGSWSDGGALSHTVTASTNYTYTANFTTQYYLTLTAGLGGSVSPSSGWNNSNATVSISATASNGYSFSGWSGSGSGSYSGGSNLVSVTMNGPITEAASFALIPTRVISLNGNLTFGNVIVGSSSNLTFAIDNTGNSTLTVSNIVYPAGFSGNWSGAIASGGSTNLTVTFLPLVATNYNGNLTVNSDATSGGNTLAVSGVGVPQTNGVPPNLAILAIGVNADSSVTLIYATTPGFTYHVEVTTNLVPASWTTLVGSATNATGSSVSFTDTSAPGNRQLFYRVGSP
jgi:alpha-1,3-glucanase-like protein/List-Bact-rpt repeat protein/HYDIN/CFA65/VesB family protein